ncbi:MAG TPA: putative hydroxymethylpyrimidine transporter CytX [Bacillota bacterium]|jgi:putative hydroxymethylpyrimidine transporter CytX|nr:putative hydroxymethylpyrimidine transporter CytX [Bacillota bacterium]HPW40801.1 putative hydroxymethylpyrimidine transporter CytX [Bacillota bacterium]
MNKSNNNLTLLSFAALWFGAAVSIAEILTGGLLAPLGFKNGIIAIIIGHIIGTLILVAGGIIGTETGLPSIASTGISFGKYGAYVFSVLNVLQLLGWTAVMIISGARSVNEIAKVLWSFDNIYLWSAVIGGLICLWIFFGNVGVKKLNLIAVVLLFILTVMLSAVVFKNSELFSSSGDGTLSFGSAIELNVIMPLSWLPLIADYTRFAKRKGDAVTGSFLGYFTGSTWMYTIGLGAAIASGNSDPGAMMLSANLGFTALGIVILSTVTTTFLDANSAGVTFLNLFPKLNERKTALGMGAAGTLIAVIVPIEQYQNFLYAIGSVFAPLFAILLTEYFVLKKSRKLQEGLLANWGASAVWVAGVIMYYQFIKLDFVLGATVPVMIITGLLYCLSWRWTESWILLEKHRNC